MGNIFYENVDEEEAAQGKGEAEEGKKEGETNLQVGTCLVFWGGTLFGRDGLSK